MYANDTTLSSTLDSFSTHEENGNVEFSIKIELHNICEWLKQNKLSLNLNKFKYMLFKTARRKFINPPLLKKINNINIDRVHELNFLGLTFNEKLNWKNHIDKISNKCSRPLNTYDYYLLT